MEIVYKDNTKKSIPVERVDDIYVMTEFDFNTSLLNFLSQFGINIHFFNYYGFYKQKLPHRSADGLQTFQIKDFDAG